MLPVPFLGVLVPLIAALGIARRFGHGAGFVIGLWLLPFIFYPILAAGAPPARPATPST